ncbi:MAG: glycosyltransferase [Gammaproteobacteria bacterium]|nr:glycosyltransferase [Gammaproteobacteria bacterium]
MLREGWDVEGLFLDDPVSEGHLRTWRFPIDRKRGGALRYVFEYTSFFVWSFVWLSLRTLVRRPALVYVNSPPDFFVFAAIVPKLLGVPVVLDIHDPMPELFVSKERTSRAVIRLLETQERWSLRFADRVITVHEPLRELLSSRTHRVPIDVVMNVPDLEGWEPASERPAGRVMVFTGSVAVRYGIDDVIRALAEVRDAIPGIRFRIVGEGEDEKRLADLAAELGVADQIEFLGRVAYRDIPSVLADAWVGVNVPKPDALGGLSFSNKIVEWVLLGIPVIAGRSSTLLRYFPEGTLIYVQPGDPGEIAAALVRLDAASTADIEKRGEASRAAVEAISWPVQREQLLGVLTGVMDAAKGPDRMSGH